MNVLEQQQLCDVKFFIGKEKKEFGVSRFGLATISQPFKAMLYGNMEESKKNAEIEIEDIDPDAFEQVLRYSYCNDPLLTPGNVVAVKKVCDKYQIASLSKFVMNISKNFEMSQIYLHYKFNR